MPRFSKKLTKCPRGIDGRKRRCEIPGSESSINITAEDKKEKNCKTTDQFN